MDETRLRAEILELVANYARRVHAPKPFVPGESFVPVSGRVFWEEEVQNLVESALDFWLTSGRFNDAFEKALSDFLAARFALTANSGSSANLLAIAALTSHLLDDHSVNPGDEVITVAAAFPTTVNPLLHYGLIPVFVDVEIPTYNIDVRQLEGAISEKTKAIVLAHTLGNPFNIDEVIRMVEKYNLWLIEDCCDALGSTYNGKSVGNFGHLSTLSFYPAHHITTGEGGAIVTNDNRFRRIVQSLRDWGRDCICPPGKDNTCGKRFDMQFGTLPVGYDHKYVYSHIGYNFKLTEMQAAVGLAQLSRIHQFIETRKQNFMYLRERLSDFEGCLILPEATPKSDPSWFGFPISLAEDIKIPREGLLSYLNEKKIGTRLLFGGNITRQPYFQGQKYRIHNGLRNTDFVMKKTFWVGIYPGLDFAMLDYVADHIERFFRKNL
jgi:CDP-6-deoxy-D-xylo-4-hexulose-3-dehydrase